MARCHRSSPRHVLCPSLSHPLTPQSMKCLKANQGDSRPIPLMTSSRINRAPCLLQTDFIALKYPLGAGSAPVVAPTTVSATTLKGPALGPQPLSVKGRGRRRLTSYDGIWSKLHKLVLEFLAEPFHVLLFGFFRVFKTLCVGWRHSMKVLMLENFIIWLATRGVSRQR